MSCTSCGNKERRPLRSTDSTSRRSNRVPARENITNLHAATTRGPAGSAQARITNLHWKSR